MNFFCVDYLKRLSELFENFDLEVVEQIEKSLENAGGLGSNIYILGNGGSSSTGSHMVNDLGVGLSRRNIRNFNILNLTDNTAVITALANDVGYENIFLAQLVNKLKQDDVIIAISCSGNSPNVIKAVNYAKEVGATVIGLTGFDGGALKELSDISFHVETQHGEYGLVEDMHMILDHMIYSYYISKASKGEL